MDIHVHVHIPMDIHVHVHIPMDIHVHVHIPMDIHCTPSLSLSLHYLWLVEIISEHNSQYIIGLNPLLINK